MKPARDSMILDFHVFLEPPDTCIDGTSSEGGRASATLTFRSVNQEDRILGTLIVQQNNDKISPSQKIHIH